MEKFHDNKSISAAILMDVQKAFYTINHDLLIAELQVYGVPGTSLKLVKNYLIIRFKMTKVNVTYTSWEELLRGMSQGSVLGPLLFNIYLNDMFLTVERTETFQTI